MMNPWGDTPVVWTYPSLVDGITETLYCDCPHLAPTSTYKTAALAKGEHIIIIPTRAATTVEQSAVLDKDGKTLQPAVVKREVVPVTQYRVAMEAKTVELAEKAEVKPIKEVGLPVSRL